QAISLAVIAVLVGIDQLTKYAAVSTVMVDGPKEFLFGLFQFRYVENTGAAFSLFEGKTALLAVFSALVMAVGFYILIARKLKSKVLVASVVMIMGGGLGNLIDRIRLQFVVDYIEALFVDFPVFNFADCFITVGEFILVGYLLWDIFRDFKKGRSKTDGE
ncbi:MAG: signal peptidase II, partial [Acutalibacteraceae bacterium]|nr:signal peptidase II [Acutalibacteraceae bacterium]